MRSAAARNGGLAPLWRLVALFLGLAVLVALPFLIWGGELESALGPERMAAWFAEHRGSAWLIAIGLLVLDIALPIPNTVIIAALGAFYGPFLGGLLATIGTSLSGLLAYGLCRRYGRPLARRILNDAELSAGEALVARSGAPLVAAFRALPILSETIACIAGLARMPLSTFALALVCGAAPLGFIVAAIGYSGAERPLATLLACAVLPLPLWFVARVFFAQVGRAAHSDTSRN